MGKARLPKTLLFKAAALIAGFGLGILSYPVHAAPSGGDTVKGLYDALLSTMKNGRMLDLLSIGPSRTSLSDVQHQQVTDSFGRYISAIYADRFKTAMSDKSWVTGEQPAPTGIMVRSQIIKADGERVKVNHLMRCKGDTWLISDIYFDGAISEVATHRSEFSAILKNEGA